MSKTSKQLSIKKSTDFSWGTSLVYYLNLKCKEVL